MTAHTTSRTRRPKTEPTDLGQKAIVVGSGFGGAVTACRLAQAGIQPLILERGRRYESNDFPALPEPGALLPDLRRWTWEHEQGICDVLDLEEVIAFQAAGYGGGSLIYANVHLRAPDAVFDERWPSEYRRKGALTPYYDLVAHMLEPAPITAHEEDPEHPLPEMPKVRVMGRVAGELERTKEFFHPPLAIRRKKGLNIHGVEQNQCQRCGACVTGCPHRAKNTLDLNYLAVAEQNGALVKTQCEVLDIESIPGGGWGVECYDHLVARPVRFEAPYVFLCAGSIHSTRLLARARLPNADVQKVVGVGYHAGGGAAGLVFDTRESLEPSRGPTITTTIVHSQSPGSFFLIQDGGYARELERFLGVFRAPLWLGRNRLSQSTVEAPPDTSVPGKASNMPSPLDGVLDMVAAGGLSNVVPEQLRGALPGFRSELRDMLLLPHVVEHTIDLCIRAGHDSSWILRHTDERGHVHKWARWLLDHVAMPIQKAFIRWAFGSSETIANHALSAVLVQGNLKRHEVAAKLFGYDAGAPARRLMLLAMGRDAAPGVLEYEADRERVVADLDLYKLGPRYAEEEQLMTDIAKKLGGELRASPAWSFLGKPFSVHNQGGCPMSDDPELGVLDPDGQVYGCPGLFVFDGAALCTSVGVNPAATIAAIAERNVLRFIRRELRNPEWPRNAVTAGARQYAKHREDSRDWGKRAESKGWKIAPPISGPSRPTAALPIGIKFSERMEGYFAETNRCPRRDAEYRELEIAGRPRSYMKLHLDVGVANLALFFEDMTHELRVAGTVELLLPGHDEATTTDVRGTLQLMVPRFKPYGIDRRDERRLAAQRRFDPHSRTRAGGPRPGRTRKMIYDLTFEAAGKSWVLRAYKRIRDDAGLDAWRDTSAAFVSLYEVLPPEDGRAKKRIRGAGVVHVDLPGFLFEQVHSMQVGFLSEDREQAGLEIEETEDPAQVIWATTTFARFFFGELQRIYSPELKGALESLFGVHRGNVRTEPPRPRR